MTNADAWDYAIGMIKAEGLELTEEYKEYMEKESTPKVVLLLNYGFALQYIIQTVNI